MYSKQISKLSQNRGFNAYYWVIGYAESKYLIETTCGKYLLCTVELG